MKTYVPLSKGYLTAAILSVIAAFSANAAFTVTFAGVSAVGPTPYGEYYDYTFNISGNTVPTDPYVPLSYGIIVGASGFAGVSNPFYYDPEYYVSGFLGSEDVLGQMGGVGSDSSPTSCQTSENIPAGSFS